MSFERKMWGHLSFELITNQMMKEKLLFFATAVFVSTSCFAQNLVTNGGFELPNDEKKHLFITERTGWLSDDTVENHNGTEYQAGWEGKYYQYCVNTAGTIYQPIDKITADSTFYNVSYLYSIGWNDDAGKDTVYSVVYLSHYTPGSDIKNREIIDSVAIDVTSLLWNRQLVKAVFKLPANSDYVGDSLVVEFATRVKNVDNVSNNTWSNLDSVVVYKSNFVWAEFNLATKIDTTNIKNSSDFSVKGKAAWDSKYIYLHFDVTDDSIYAVGESNTWELDNFEIYFDLKNNKTPSWPRGQANWPSSFDGEGGTYQLRMIPGQAFDSVNTNYKGWAAQNYQVTNSGYSFDFTVCLDSLLKGFVPEVGKEIGFDVLASDNDNSPYYRDQMSWHAPLGSIWSDAALWGTVKFANNGGFEVVTDEEKPTEALNLAATKGNKQVLLSWDAAIDNIVVDKYVVLVNDKPVDTVYAQKTTNSCVVKNVTPGDYKLGVIAEDVEGNQSAQTSISYNYTGVKGAEINSLTISPNPSSSFISFNNESLVNIRIFNAAGQMVLLKTVEPQEKIDISSLKVGIYNVRIVGVNAASVLKLVKK
jgi:hypothetical protein